MLPYAVTNFRLFAERWNSFTWHHLSQLTKADEAKGLSSDPGRPWRHLPDLLHALDPRALPESLV